MPSRFISSLFISLLQISGVTLASCLHRKGPPATVQSLHPRPPGLGAALSLAFCKESPGLYIGSQPSLCPHPPGPAWGDFSFRGLWISIFSWDPFPAIQYWELEFR